MIKKTIIKAPPSVYLNGTLLSPSDINRDHFEKILQVRDYISKEVKLLTAEEFNLVMDVYDLAKREHGYLKQYRSTGERYFEHLKATALIVMLEFKITDPYIIAAALAHDIKEDTFNTYHRLCNRISKEVGGYVKLVTNPKKTENEAEYHAIYHIHCEIIKLSIPASIIKVADRAHNLRTLLIDDQIQELYLQLQDQSFKDGNVPVKTGKKILAIAEESKKALAKAIKKIQETEEFIIPIAQNLSAKTNDKIFINTLTIALLEVKQRAKEKEKMMKEIESELLAIESKIREENDPVPF